jgi:nucleoside-diphosphate-sugar epimerase
MKVLITGATGWLGRELTAALEGEHSLVLLDRNAPGEATVFLPGKGDREPAPFETDLPFVKAELTDVEGVRRACEGCEAIVHLAASTTGLPEFGVATFRDNALGTYIVLDEARLAGVTRVLCASSVNAFGTIYWRISGTPPVYTKMPLDETFPPVPEDSYSLSKWVNEETCAAFHRAYGLTTAAFRFAGVFNDALYEQWLVNAKQPTAAWSDDLYQWAHHNDIIAGLKRALECPTLPGHGVYYLGAADTRCPEPSMELLERFRPDLAATVETPIEGRGSLISIDRARQAFGYDPQYRLGE